MDAQDQNKTSPHGHDGHGVHLCRKCGWPFPNAHPSAKHRRAHKKFCGKIEGYQLNTSGSGHFSDDSDDEMRTPSPNMDKGNIKELGSSGGTGLLRSMKSEDDVFSDAVTEFSDSGLSPSMEEPVERVGQLEKNVGNLIDSPQTKDGENDGVTEVLDDSTRGREEAVGNPTTQSEINKPANDVRVQEVLVGVDQIDGQPMYSSSVASQNGDSEKAKELISSKPERHAEVKESVKELDSRTGDIAPLSMSVIEEPKLETRPEDLKEKGFEHVVPDYVAPEEDRKTSDTVIPEPKLLEADMNLLHSAAGDEVVEQEIEPNMVSETRNVILQPILNKADENKGSGEIEVDKDQTNMLQADMTEHDVSSQIEPPKSTDGSSSTQVEAEIEQDRDQTNVLQADKTEDDFSSQIEIPENTDGSGTANNVEDDSTEDILGHGQSKLTEDYNFKVEEGKETLLVSVSESLPVIENPKIITEDFKEYDVLKSSFPLDLGNVEVTRPVEIGETVVAEPDPSSISSITSSHSDVSSSVNLEKESVSQPVGKEVDISDLQVTSEEGLGTNGLETRHSTKNDGPEGFEPSFIDEKSASHAVELSDVTIDGVRSHTSEVENAEANVIKKSDYIITESKTTNMEATQGAVSEFCPEDRSVASDKQSEDLIEIEAQRPISSISGVSELNPEDQNQASKKNSEDSIQEYPVASVISKQSSTAVEDLHVKDATVSELSIGEADEKLTAENLNVSAVDDSAVSSSRTESLEGNWGSVSVLSTQSDGAPLRPQTTSDAYHSDYEHPSFMTLVDSRTELEKGAEASEINPVQRTEPTKSADALEAGWIPSLTNVVNESEGRKKNEEIIAKVTNWSSGKQHSPLKNRLNEAYAETKVKTATEKQLPVKDQADETASKNNGAAVTTVSSIMGSETPVHDAAKREMEREWNSPARYPAEIKKEKKKGKPYWVPFVCCSSVHRDM